MTTTHSSTPLPSAGCHELLQAVMAGDLRMLLDCITSANVNYVDPQYRLSLVMWAVSLGRLPTTELLLSCGASIAQVDRYGFTILHRAVWSGDVSLLRMILFLSPAYLLNGKRDGVGHGSSLGAMRWRHGAQRLINAIHSGTGRTPLMLAAVRGDVAVVRFLLQDCQADLYLVDKDGLSAMDLAALCGHCSVVQILLELAPGDGTGSICFPEPQQRAEDYCDIAKTVPQRFRLRSVNKRLTEELMEASRIAAQ